MGKIAQYSAEAPFDSVACHARVRNKDNTKIDIDINECHVSDWKCKDMNFIINQYKINGNVTAHVQPYICTLYSVQAINLFILYTDDSIIELTLSFIFFYFFPISFNMYDFFPIITLDNIFNIKMGMILLTSIHLRSPYRLQKPQHFMNCEEHKLCCEWQTDGGGGALLVTH